MLKKLCILIVIFCGHCAHGQAHRGPVAKYTFNNGSLKDEAGDNDARAYGVVFTKDRFDNDNSTCSFMGNFDSYVSLGTSPALKPKIGSISLWVRLEQVIHKGKGVYGNPIIFTRSHEGEDFNDAYVISYSVLVRKFHATNSFSEEKQVYLTPVETHYARQWYHIVLTYDNDYSCLYINGALDAKAAKNFESCFLKSDSVIVGGQLGKKNSRYFNGQIDDLEIYDRVLSAGEVLSLYNAPNPNKRAIITRWVLISIVGFTGLLALAWWVKRRVARAVNAEKERNRLNNRLIELETRAIRAQMNPHFIFNSLNTLQRFILEDNKDKSYTYLIEFSRLLRKLLESSESDTISLKEEIEILDAYLEIEKLRFDNSFGCHITSDLEQMEFVYIPIMLIQPFVENAIWHGLLNKKGRRCLSISFKSIDDKKILCEIDDNGVGRSFKDKEPGEIKKKSLALDFIRQRLDLIRQATGIECSFELIDKKDSDGSSLGTTVKIIIPRS